MNSTANELSKLLEEDPDQYMQVLSAAEFKEFTLGLRVNMETFNVSYAMCYD